MAFNPQREQPKTGQPMSLQEYFALDYLFPNEKYEYHDGVVRLMSGGSLAHSTIAFNAQTALHQQFRGGPCSVVNSDMRVQVADGKSYYYPDVTVSRNVADRHRENRLIRSPHIVVEVLSPSNENTDRNEKVRNYQATESIYEIVLISQFAVHVEVYQRAEDDKSKWQLVTYGPGDEVVLPSLDIHIPIEELYVDIDFSQPLREDEA